MSMLGLLAPFARLLKPKEVDIYGTVFRLHCKLTVLLFLAFSALVSAHEFFGKPMDCVGSDLHQVDPYINNYCWINGTFTVSMSQAKIIGVHQMAHGVSGAHGEERKYHLYYQWVNLILLCQAILFYIPAYVWKIWEHGRLAAISNNLDSPITPDNYPTIRATILHYLKGDNQHEHTMYALHFYVCELLNLAVVLANMFLLEIVFRGFWFVYAPAIRMLFRRDLAGWSAATAIVFPKQTKCEYYAYGPSGSMQLKDFGCMLALNILNEKIFAFVWLWLVFMCAVSLLNVAYSTLCFASVQFRMKLLRAKVRTLRADQLFEVTNRGAFGEWFVLAKMERNVHSGVFRDLLVGLVQLKAEKYDA